MATYLLDNDMKSVLLIKKKNITNLVIEQELNSSDTIQCSLTSSDEISKYMLKDNVNSGYIVTTFKNKTVIYRINEIEIVSEDNSFNIYGSNIGYDDLSGMYQSFEKTYTASELINHILAGTGWDFILKLKKPRTNHYEYKDTSVLDILNDFIAYQKCDMMFEIRFNDKNEITHKIVVLEDKIGGDDYRNRLVYNKNISNIKINQDSSQIISRGIGRGKEITDKDGNHLGYVNFEDITWNKPNKPINKPSGKDYFESQEAFKIKKLSNGKHRTKIYSFDTEDPNELIDLVYAEFAEDSRPKAKFEIDVADLPQSIDLGETITVIRNDIGLKYKSRVFKITHDLLYPVNDSCEIGDVIYKSVAKRVKRLEKQEKKIKDKIEKPPKLVADGVNYPRVPHDWFTYVKMPYSPEDNGEGEYRPLNYWTIVGYSTLGANNIIGGTIDSAGGFKIPQYRKVQRTLSNGEVVEIDEEIIQMGGGSFSNAGELGRVNKYMYDNLGILIPTTIRNIVADGAAFHCKMLHFDEGTDFENEDVNNSYNLYIGNSYARQSALAHWKIKAGTVVLPQRYEYFKKNKHNRVANNYSYLGESLGVIIKDNSLYPDSSNKTCIRGNSKSEDGCYYITKNKDNVELKGLTPQGLSDLVDNGFSINIDNEINSIGSKSMGSIVKLTSFYAPKIENVGNNGFASSKVTSIVLSDKLKTISTESFMDCKNLTSLNSEGILFANKIGARAFKNCSVLNLSPVEYVTDPNQIANKLKDKNVHTTEVIEEEAFKGANTSILRLIPAMYKLKSVGRDALDVGSPNEYSVFDFSNNYLLEFSNDYWMFNSPYMSSIKFADLTNRLVINNAGVNEVTLTPSAKNLITGGYFSSSSRTINIDFKNLININGAFGDYIYSTSYDFSYPNMFGGIHTYNYGSNLNKLFTSTSGVARFNLEDSFRVKTNSMSRSSFSLSINYSKFNTTTCETLFKDGRLTSDLTISTCAKNMPNYMLQNVDFQGNSIVNTEGDGFISPIPTGFLMGTKNINPNLVLGKSFFKDLKDIPTDFMQNSSLQSLDLSDCVVDSVGARAFKGNLIKNIKFNTDITYTFGAEAFTGNLFTEVTLKEGTKVGSAFDKNVTITYV